MLLSTKVRSATGTLQLCLMKMVQASPCSTTLLGRGKQVQDAEPALSPSTLLRSQPTLPAGPGRSLSWRRKHMKELVSAHQTLQETTDLPASPAIAAKRPFSTRDSSCVCINCLGCPALPRGSCARLAPWLSTERALLSRKGACLPSI